MKKFSPENHVLKKLCYESSGGSMNFHSEFEIVVCADEIVRAAYWNDYYFDSCEIEAGQDRLSEIDDNCRVNPEKDEMTVREHISMNRDLWAALTEEIGYLKEQLKPVDNKKSILKPIADLIVLDGGDYTRLYITWEKGGEEKTVQYYSPSGNRWSSVLAILHEMVRPFGRDLRRTGKTQITEMYLKTPDYSYQISRVKGSDGYYFFVHGDKSDKSRLTQGEWFTMREYLNGLDISDFKTGTHEDKYYLRLTYNDGLSKNLVIDKKTAKKIKSFIRENVL